MALSAPDTYVMSRESKYRNCCQRKETDATQHRQNRHAHANRTNKMRKQSIHATCVSPHAPHMRSHTQAHIASAQRMAARPDLVHRHKGQGGWRRRQRHSRDETQAHTRRVVFQAKEQRGPSGRPAQAQSRRMSKRGQRRRS